MDAERAPREESSGGALRAFFVSLTATAAFVAIVLVSAGRIALLPAWVYGAFSLALNVAQRLILRREPELANERARPRADAPAWDKALLGVGLLLTIAMLVTAGLEARFGGPRLPFACFVAGVALYVAGSLVFVWALRENRFFTAVVRVQAERRHAVCTTGPYRVVRHPGNLGMIVGTLGFPLLFQSAWSFVPAGLAIVTLVVRTALEDATLTKELEGYRDYRAETRFRLVPGVW